MSWLQRAFASLRAIWEEMDPKLYAPQDPALTQLDENRMEFSWQGQPFLFDHAVKSVARAGRVVARYDEIEEIGILERRGHERARSWLVVLQIADLSNVLIGETVEKLDASLAAAHLARATGKTVRLL